MPNTPVKSTAASLTTSPSAAPVEHDEMARLRAENERLREELAAAREGRSVQPAKPVEPSFGISEGTREELERTGKATSPFTGKALSKDDLK